MKIFIAGTASHIEIAKKNPPRFLLESFYYFKPEQIPLMKNAEDFILDSGAFSFREKFKKEIDWSEYVERYAQFIVEHDVKHFIELDIDNLIGYENVLKYRKLLEKLTDRKCIPVWHTNRGISEFKNMCDEYEYASVGGIVASTKKERNRFINIFPKLIEEGNRRGCKLHGLGFTSTSKYDKIKFYSTDSTTWTMASRMGNLCYFDGRCMKQWYPSLNNKKPSNIKQAMEFSYNEWRKFQEWAVKNL